MIIKVIKTETGEEENREMTPEEKADFNERNIQFDEEKPERILAGIRSEAFRRIRLILPAWMVEREMTGGNIIPQEIKDQVAQIRLRSNELEADLTEDFLNDKYW